MGTLDMAVVIDLDALRRRVEAEPVGDALQQLLLRRALGQPSRQRLARVDERMLDQLPLGAALRRRRARPCGRRGVESASAMSAALGGVSLTSTQGGATRLA